GRQELRPGLVKERSRSAPRAAPQLKSLPAHTRPITDTRAVGQVSATGTKEFRIYAAGIIAVSYRGETETIAGGKSYRVILDPPDDSPKRKEPLRPAQWPKPFKVVIIGVAVVALGIYDLLEMESPDRPSG
ncbi:MAG TPA: hypothetical protein VNB49_18690, partial [Candidatus Dormibacteraeota bacterium]|nr:hypothetical protein [Candidatus Dormibacteraeota bacterium]